MQLFGVPYVQSPSVSHYREITVLLADGPHSGNPGTVYVRLKNTGQLYSIPRNHRSFAPLHYVLLHPAGDDGYYTARPMTCLEYHRYRLHYRRHRPDGHCLLLAGRLFHEYLCVSFANIEADRLDWYRNNQRKMRIERWQNLHDHVCAGDGTPAGKRIILGPAFTNGPRNQHAKFQDAMAIVRDRGKPSLFITFTCNPKWDEIVQSLPPTQRAEDRPDVVSRVFRAKFKLLMDDLVHKHVLGTVSSYLSVIEFQKRGLPHAHILLIFCATSKIVVSYQI